MIRVRTVGFANGGAPQTSTFECDTVTVGDVMSRIGVDASNALIVMNGRECSLSDAVVDGSTINYTMRNIKGA